MSEKIIESISREEFETLQKSFPEIRHLDTDEIFTWIEKKKVTRKIAEEILRTWVESMKITRLI